MVMFIQRATHVHATTMLGPKPNRGRSNILARELRSCCTEGKTITECTDRNARGLILFYWKRAFYVGQFVQSLYGESHWAPSEV